LTAIAAVVLFAGCGGGSAKKSAVSSSASAPRAVSATAGVFRTVVPLGFTTIDSKAQFYATGLDEDKVVTSLVVIREPVRLGDVNAVARRTLRLRSHQRNTHQVSHPSPLTVGGEPALELDYVLTEGGREWHAREVFVRHRGFVYYIRDFSPGQYALASTALEELLGSWQWQ
jgi:hypothetical protein